MRKTLKKVVITSELDDETGRTEIRVHQEGTSTSDAIALTAVAQSILISGDD